MPTDPITEVRTFTVSTPAGTAIATPLVTALAMPARIVERVRLRVPPGPLGNLGVALGLAGVQVIPWNVGEWLVMDDETLDWPLEGQPTSGAWQLRTYNVGKYPHLVYVTFLLRPPQTVGGPAFLSPLNLNG